MKLKGTPQEVYEKISEYLEKNKDKKEIHVLISVKETREMRTLSQNNMFHGLFTEIAKHIGEDPKDTKGNFMKGLFGVKKVKVGRFVSEEALKPHTSELNKEEGIYLINAIKGFIEKYGVPCKYTSRDFQSLIDSYS